MSYCQNCQCPVDGLACQRCGGAPAAQSSGEIDPSSLRAAARCYPYGPIGAACFLKSPIHRNSFIVRFHAWQSILTMALHTRSGRCWTPSNSVVVNLSSWRTLRMLESSCYLSSSFLDRQLGLDWLCSPQRKGARSRRFRYWVNCPAFWQPGELSPARYTQQGPLKT